MPLPLNNDILLSIVIFGAFVALAVALLFLLRPFFHQANRYHPQNIRKFLLVMVPQESGNQQQAGAEQRIDQIREKIAVGESLFAAIGGLKAQRGLMGWLRGRTDHLSFEIVVQKKVISFYVAVPSAMAPYITEQIHAQYPDAHVEEVPAYNIFPRTGVALGANLKLAKQFAYPIKTYKKMESDPLSAITNPLSQVEEADSAAIQFVIRSAHKKWRHAGLAVVKRAQKGQGFNKQNSGILGQVGKEFAQAALGNGTPTSQQSLQPVQLTQMEQELIRSVEEKASKAGMDVNVRVVVASQDQLRAKRYLDNIVNAFSQYNLYQYGNTFSAEIPSKQDRVIRDFIYRTFNEQRGVVLNTEEMTSLFHFPLPSTETPGIRWLEARKAAPPVNLPQEGLRLGRVAYRGQEQAVRIKRADRRRHFYLIGKSGSGKTTLMQNMAVQDVLAGEGVAVIDPHGDFAEYVLQRIPESRIDDVIYFNPSDIERPMGLNMLEAKTADQRDFAVQEMIAIFYSLFPPEMIGPMFEHNMRNVMLTLMADIENPGTITEIPRMFSDEEFAAQWLAKVTDPVVRLFWEKEMAQQTANTKSEMLGYLISKVGRFVENEMLRNIIGQSHSAFDFRDVMDNKKILIVNLSKGTTGEINANLLGMILVSKLQMAAMSRAALPEDQRHDFYLYIDEFQNFITDSIATILSEARKYRLDLIIGHQYLGQLAPKGDAKIRDAVLGNVGTIACYRIGVEDAEILAKEFAPVFSAHDLVNVEKYTAYLKLLIDNTAARPFNLLVDPPDNGNKELGEGIKELSRLKFGRDRRLVEAEIKERSQLGVAAPIPEPELAKATL